jgi:hypothetical protein
VTDAGVAADADAIDGGADDIGRAPATGTTTIYCRITGWPVGGGDSKCGSDGGAMCLGEQRRGDSKRGSDGGAMGLGKERRGNSRCDSGSRAMGLREERLGDFSTGA